MLTKLKWGCWIVTFGTTIIVESIYMTLYEDLYYIYVPVSIIGNPKWCGTFIYNNYGLLLGWVYFRIFHNVTQECLTHPCYNIESTESWFNDSTHTQSNGYIAIVIVPFLWTLLQVVRLQKRKRYDEERYDEGYDLTNDPRYILFMAIYTHSSSWWS